MGNISKKSNTAKESAKKKKQQVLDKLHAIQTLIERFPTLLTISSEYDSQTVFGYLLGLLSDLGWTQDDMLAYVCKLLGDNNGFLDSVENSIKAILMANVKNMVNCSLNPFIPNSLMYEINDDDQRVKYDTGSGLTVSVDEIDLYGILDKCPTSTSGSVFYFDAKTSLYKQTASDEDTDENSTDLSIISALSDNGYTPNELWKSCDFNAYLWYIIHKSTWAKNHYYTNFWDNRVKCLKQFKDNNSFADTFFTEKKQLNFDVGLLGQNIYDETVIVTDGNLSVKQKNMLLCRYVDRTEDRVNGDVIRIWLNPDVYFHKRTFKFTIEIPEIRFGQGQEKKVYKLISDITVFTEASNVVYTLEGKNDYQEYTYERTEEKWEDDKYYSVNTYNTAGTNILNGVSATANKLNGLTETVITETIRDLIGDIGDIFINKIEDRKVEVQVNLNKTLFEFNYDYIYSLKLFSPKVLVANILNAILGLTSVEITDLSLTPERTVIQGAVGSMVREFIDTEDGEEVTDCFFSFDNDDYDTLLQDAILKHEGKYEYADGETIEYDYDSIIDSISQIDDNGEYNETVTAIQNTIENIAVSLAQNEHVTTGWNVKFDFLMQFLEQTITEIVMQILSPKVAMLFKINSLVMGEVDTTSASDISKVSSTKIKKELNDSWTKFIKQLKNLIPSLVKQIASLLIKQFLEMVIIEIKTLVQKLSIKLAEEIIKDYKDLINNLLNNCIMQFKLNNKGGLSYIDNVQYADIVPTATEPKTDTC